MIRSKSVEGRLRDGRFDAKTRDSLFRRRIEQGANWTLLAAGPMDRPGPQQGIDEDVQVLAETVAGLDHVAAVTVDEGREMGAPPRGRADSR